ncbi:protein CHLOROPLAST IMPORT APPARATUS 2-like isoform X2 [Diospyros lotus]|uniref:protein CHLOROPLAST IMPORT APPARATUS 2-like isoform X2 n=1 Tax=Diospyros lotus TaxID=55363 RepID=UPI0022563128|nr:protein CHLOROPLAST IMPORT APPARATUS 2-like isoform X2 [Diospyros lotus]
MSSCLSGGGRAYGFDLEIVKSPSTSTITSHSSSPSSTLSESSNSPLAISTRKPRTPRKRPNQTYNEAAAILSTAYPKLFSAKHLTKPFKLAKPHESFLDEPSDLLLPFRVFENSGFLLHHPIPEKPNSTMEPRIVNSCEKFCHGQMAVNPLSLCNGYQDDFDAGSILDEEMEEGGNCIDSIMGNLSVNNDSVDERTYWYGSVFPGKFEVGRFGMRNGVRALRQVEDGDWWRFSTVNVGDISPRLRKPPPPAEKKKKKIEEIKSVESAKEFTPAVPENSVPKSNPGLLLKLNVEEVVNAWSDRGSPFSEEFPGQETASGNDLHARLAQVELFPDNGGVREASVLRYKEKRRTRLFSKKIRYQVRKVNADRRPRMKGRFVRSPNSKHVKQTCSQQQ